ncbi:unnamed protein product [Ophioblennius macclurei]
MVLMEEDNPDIADAILQQPPQESRTSINLLNGQLEDEAEEEEEEAAAASADGTDESSSRCSSLSSEADLWERLIWSARPLSCASPRLSFATVQWDVPAVAGDERGDATDPEDQPRDVPGEPLKREERAPHAGFDSQPPNSDVHRTGNYAEPCDAAAEPATQEREESTHELPESNGEVRSSTNSEEDEEPPDPIEDLTDAAEENRNSESEGDGSADVKAEEEREESDALLTEQLESEEEEGEGEEASADAGQIGEDEEFQVEEGQISASCSEESEEENADDCEADADSPEELLQTEDITPTFNPDEPTDLQQPELLEETPCSDTDEEDPACQIERTEMCVGPNVNSEQSKVADGSDEASIQEAENEEKIESIYKIVGEIKDPVEEVNSLEDGEASSSSSSSSESLQSESTQGDMTEIPEQISAEGRVSEGEESLESAEMKLTDQDQASPEAAEPVRTEQTVCVEAEESAEMEQTEQNEPLRTSDSPQPEPAEKETNESEGTEQLVADSEVTPQTPHEDEDPQTTQDEDAPTVLANGASPHMNGGEVDREKAQRLAERLFKLDGIQRADVVKHIDKDNDFSRVVGEEYLKFFDFTGQTLDQALRSFLKVVILIGETQERERVLQHFACRFHQCNPDSFPSSGAVLALTCALMLLNTDLHGQNVGKSMSSSKFVSNLDGMNEEGNFSKDLLKSLYNSIKSEPLQWAVDEEELKSAVLLEEDAGADAPMRSKANPFQDVPHDKKAAVVKEGILQRKLHADVDGKRTPWGKRGWKTFYGVLRGMVLYLLKDDYRGQHQTQEEVVSVHHALAEPAADYTKKPNVFRLQTADWRVFLFQASNKVEMNSWIGRINLISALHSSPPFPAAVGSQRRFCRPILPASQSDHTLDLQLQFHSRMLDSFKEDLSELQKNPPEGRKAKAKDLEEHRVRAEYLHYEVCRYEIYLQVLEGWDGVHQTGDGVLNVASLKQFDKAVCADAAEKGEEEEEEEEGGMKRSHSSPSLEADMTPPQQVKVRRNISERRTYRRIVIPRVNKET